MPKTSLHFLFAAICLTPVAGLAQQSRIVGKIDNTQRITLAGHLHPRAQPQYDQGPVDPDMALPIVTVELERSPAQQAALKTLLAEQQDPSSPNYHKWLTPQQFGDQFGASQDDINKIVEWLKSQNLTVTSVAPSRNAITVSGTAATVEKAFGVEIHHYVINGQSHFANATNPSVPAAFSGVIGSIRGLNNFRLRPQLKSRTIVPHASNPRYTDSQGNHYLAPEDVATIYNITPLHNAGLNGSGQKIVVVGQTDIRTADIDQFRSTFNLPAINLQQVLVPGSTDPGVIPPCEPSTPSTEECGDLSEADLDLELSGAVAPNATIIFVYADPNTTDGVETAVEYAIQQNLAPVISMSYGDCEYAYSAAQANSMQSLAQQAVAEGITWFAASGDNGATDCYGDTLPNVNADTVASVDMPGSIPEVVAVGGTEFVDTSSNWNSTNDANGGSALGYIPETAWNDSAEDGSPSASGGGASVLFSKPSWQTGEGVPNDGFRDVPDIAISASADHDGYLIYTSDGCESARSTNTCQMIVGGTSVGAPQMSGLFTLLNQELVNSGALSSPGLGDIHQELYSLFQTAYAADYHDITTGNNDITICTRSGRGCESVGFSAGPGYDQVTGIGSLNADALLTAWKGNSTGTGSGGGTGGSGGGQTSPSAPTITGIVNAASFQQGFAPGELVSVFGSDLAPAAQGASSVPLPPQMQGVTATVTQGNNSLTAYLDYVSASQINLQIPYELAPGTTATLTINDNGSTVSTTFPVTAAAPGIFTDPSDAPVPNTSAAPGQTVTLFITGAGAVTPGINDGVAPPASTPIGNLPTPTQSVTVTIGGLGGIAGLSAPTTFVGIPEALVGVVQINYTVPANAPLGPQPIVVTVGGVASTAATLTIE